MKRILKYLLAIASLIIVSLLLTFAITSKVILPLDLSATEIILVHIFIMIPIIMGVMCAISIPVAIFRIVKNKQGRRRYWVYSLVLFIIGLITVIIIIGILLLMPSTLEVKLIMIIAVSGAIAFICILGESIYKLLKSK